MDITMERKRLLALGNNLSLEVHHVWLKEEARLHAITLNTSLQTINLANTLEFKRQDKVLWLLHRCRSVLELKNKWFDGWLDTQSDMSLHIVIVFVILILVIVFVEWILNLVWVHVYDVLILERLFFDWLHNL